MKRIIITVTAVIFSISFCMAQNIKQESEAKRQQEAQQQQGTEEQKRREAEANRRALEEKQRTQNSHTVTFNSDGGSAVTTQTIYNGETAKTPTNPTKTNHAFVEWHREGESTAFNFNIPITAPVILQAIWTNLAPTVTVTSEGSVIRGATLVAKLDWLDRNAESHNTYIVEVSTSENIAPHTLEYRGAINIIVVLRSDNENRIIRLSSNGTMFSIRSNVIFILDNNITLQGHSQNNGSMVDVNGGIFKMNRGSTITDNNGGGVNVRSGTFEMNGGSISNNGKSTNFAGGGVNNRDVFTMNGGTISGNTASNGGGVYNYGTFTMTGGAISGNTATNGGGVDVSRGTFTMRGGSITSNVAEKYGGGVFATGGWNGGTFIKTGGTIIGYNSDPSNGNVVKDHSGTLARRGHAVFVNENMRKEKSAASHINLSNNNKENWDQ